MFNDKDWADWQPPGKKHNMDTLRYNFRIGVKDVQGMRDDVDGKKGDEKYKEGMFYKNKGELYTANNNLIEKVKREDREIMVLSKLMAELEDEIKVYLSERTSKKYKNVQARLCYITKMNKDLTPTSQANISLKDQYSKRLTRLCIEFEKRSHSLVELLEKQMAEGNRSNTSDKTNSQKNLQVRKYAIDKYKEEVTGVVNRFLQQYKDKFKDEKEQITFGTWVVGSKVLNQEVNFFTKKRHPWNTFHVTDKTKKEISKYLKIKMQKYIIGEVYYKIK